VLCDGADKNGFRFIDHFPKALIDGEPNNTEMKFRAKNGSLFQIIGSDHFDTVMGSNPVGMIFSEYSLQDPICWSYFRPILAENDGFAVFNFTPRGENHAFDLYNLAKDDPENWFCELLTVADTKAISEVVLEQEKREITRLNGNDALFYQEFFCSFQCPISGAYYAEQINRAYQDGRITVTPHDPRYTVDTWWDLGVNDRMAIWFTQSPRGGSDIRVIEYMEGMDKGLVHYIRELKEKDYIYGSHTAPHDIAQRELTSGESRLDTARELGIDFEVAPKLPVVDGIDAVRNLFPRIRFDAVKCRDGRNALKNYRKEYDERKKTYLNKPYHDWSSNGADALRTLAVAINSYASGEWTGIGKDGSKVKRGDRYFDDRGIGRRLDSPVNIFG